MSLSTPVVFLIFNRPDVTEQTFAAIAQAKPQKLLVVADGPRTSQETERCYRTRAVIEKVDWNCEVITNFSEKNLGCGRRISSGLNWVFSEVEEAIILEDDTLPNSSFFHFCQVLLERYRDDERIMHINGDNSLFQCRNNDSYYFSKYAHIWGWATWRRAWQHYDYHMKTWSEFKDSGLLKHACEDPYEQKYWANIFDQMSEDPQVIDTWDFQWTYACWSQGGLAIAPNVNLVSNLGMGHSDSVHTKNNDPRSKLPTSNIGEIKHPSFIVPHREADRFTFDNIFGGKEMREADKLSVKIRRRFSSAKWKVLSRR
jgi:hypothetical protein